MNFSDIVDFIHEAGGRDLIPFYADQLIKNLENDDYRSVDIEIFMFDGIPCVQHNEELLRNFLWKNQYVIPNNNIELSKSADKYCTYYLTVLIDENGLDFKVESNTCYTQIITEKSVQSSYYSLEDIISKLEDIIIQTQIFGITYE